MIDLHSHVLPGIDDGPDTLDGSVAIARAVVAAGIETLVATPHVSFRYRNDAATIARGVRELGVRLEQEKIALQLFAGAEIAMTHLSEMDGAELDLLGLGGGSWVLLEPPFTPLATGLEAIVRDVLRGGHRVLLAHPERCPAFQRDPAVVERLVGAGVLTSLTAGSLAGRFGRSVREFALVLLERELVHNVASDAHDTERRAPGIAAELEQAGYGSLCEWLAEAVPAAILGDAEIPARPAVAAAPASSRRWLRRRQA